MTRKDGKSRMDMLDWKAESFLPLDQAMHGGVMLSAQHPGLPLHLGPINDALIRALRNG